VCPVINHQRSIVDNTYYFSMQRFSVTDHFIVSLDIFNITVCCMETLHEIDNQSDHDPLILTLNMNWSGMPSKTNKREFHSKIAWYKDIVLPTESLHCTDLHCHNPLHAELLNRSANSIVHTCQAAADRNIPTAACNARTKSIPGWSEYVAVMKIR